MPDESFWMERAQSAEARFSTIQEQVERLKEKYRGLLETLGAREKSDGSIEIDFDALVQKLPPDQALELRAVIDQHHRISGAPGEKPRIRLSA
jgi:hypothetical protein